MKILKEQQALKRFFLQLQLMLQDSGSLDFLKSYKHPLHKIKRGNLSKPFADHAMLTHRSTKKVISMMM
jgi:hypothetical protein